MLKITFHFPSQLKNYDLTDRIRETALILKFISSAFEENETHKSADKLKFSKY